MEGCTVPLPTPCPRASGREQVRGAGGEVAGRTALENKALKTANALSGPGSPLIFQEQRGVKRGLGPPLQVVTPVRRPGWRHPRNGPCWPSGHPSLATIWMWACPTRALLTPLPEPRGLWRSSAEPQHPATRLNPCSAPWELAAQGRCGVMKKDTPKRTPLLYKIVPTTSHCRCKY